MRGVAFSALALGAFAVAACGDNVEGTDRQGGGTTIDNRTLTAYMSAATNLDATDQTTFNAGSNVFGFQWEPDVGGPDFNNDRCFGCHGGNGRGRAQIGIVGTEIDTAGAESESLVRVSEPTGVPSVPGGDVPMPYLGSGVLQLHDHSTVGLPQAVITLSWTYTTGTYPDGTTYSLRSPSLDIQMQPGGTPLPPGTLMSYRTAPKIIGLGLLEAIDAATLEAMADPDDTDGDGISGRINHVWNPLTNETEIGRFGWKSNTPTVQVQVEAAAFNDIGLTSGLAGTYFNPGSNDPIIADYALQPLTAMVQTVAVPAAGPRSIEEYQGQALFTSFGCASCHIPTLTTGTSAISTALSNQTIHPYTDLLLHDMGPGLADNQPDFEATGSEFRTAPLWGLGLDQVVRPEVTFLHDGRARTFEEAVLWHDGEAATARDNFKNADATDRTALLAFLSTL
jgi:CxxC motif-containing protein (DUF1111 family)